MPPAAVAAVCLYARPPRFVQILNSHAYACPLSPPTLSPLRCSKIDPFVGLIYRTHNVEVTVHAYIHTLVTCQSGLASPSVHAHTGLGTQYRCAYTDVLIYRAGGWDPKSAPSPYETCATHVQRARLACDSSKLREESKQTQVTGTGTVQRD